MEAMGPAASIALIVLGLGLAGYGVYQWWTLRPWRRR